jgi:hypothetical protein
MTKETAISALEQHRRLQDRVTELETAIRTHRARKADDRCIEDDDRLYESLGDGIKCDRNVGDKAAMLQNCARFIERRCEGGAWPSYHDLETALREIAKGRTSDDPTDLAAVLRMSSLAQSVIAWRER